VGDNQTALAGNFLIGLASQPNAATGQQTNFFGQSTTSNGLPNAINQGLANKNVPNVVPVMDYLNGSPLTNGTGFTNTTVLGARIKVSDDIDAGLELSAYVTTGDAIVDAFYGTTAPYLSNQFTGNTGLQGGQGLNNQPFTGMNLDNFWIIHKPTGLKLQIGSFDGTNFDDIVYVGEYNPNPLGPRYLDNFGLDLRGRTELLSPVSFERTLHSEDPITRKSEKAFRKRDPPLRRCAGRGCGVLLGASLTQPRYGRRCLRASHGNPGERLSFAAGRPAGRVQRCEGPQRLSGRERPRNLTDRQVETQEGDRSIAL
jgi:hypothetical protein